MFGFFKKKEKPEKVYIENELGKFLVTTYGPTTPMFEGVVSWPSSSLDVEAMVICSENNENVQKENFKYLKTILDQSQELDKKLKECIAKTMVEDDGLFHIWGSFDEETPDPLNEEEFISKLDLYYIRIYEDTTSEFVFPADGLYTDHDLVVRVEKDLTITECVLEG